MEDKKKLRKKIQLIRDNIPLKIRLEKARQITKKLEKTDEYQKAKSILIYYPFRSEIDTTIIIKKAIKRGKKIILPKVSGQIEGNTNTEA